MFCPVCGAEHREGFTWCSKCEVSLVEELPAEETPESDTFASVFEGEVGSATVVCAVLEGVGIEAWIKDEEEHGVLPNLGPTEVLVHETSRKAALETLEKPQRNAATNYDDSHATSKNSRNDALGHKRVAARDKRKESNISIKRNETHGKGHQGSNKRRQARNT